MLWSGWISLEKRVTHASERQQNKMLRRTNNVNLDGNSVYRDVGNFACYSGYHSDWHEALVIVI